ncbi:MAG TPA: oligosaccharide flippase family protein [Candidatus Dormibacteraeota bacterium]|jgi:O-antigen/teichoic acid export membrane protein|nr:oligosaccharide flippase family protein [Candidatus Dormibacteraeota bacterium]
MADARVSGQAAAGALASESRRDLMTRLAGTGLVARLPAPLRTPFALNNLVYFAGNFFAGLAGFVFQALLARALGKERFAEVAPLISIFYLINIAMFTSMAVAARYTAPLAAAGDRARVSRAYRDFVIYVSIFGAGGMAVFIAVSPLIRAFLHASGLGPLVALSAAVPLSLLVGVGRGVVQGEQRFLPLSVNFILYGCTTLAFLPVLLALNLHAVGAVLAIDLALVLCNLHAALTLRDLPPGGAHERLRVWPLLRSSLAASAGISVITLFYNFDVLLAKHYLSAADSGLYSTMSLLGKILFFGTVSVSAVMFPRVAALHAEGGRAHRTVDLSLGLVAALGGAVVAFYAILPGVAIRLLVGAGYLPISGYLGLFGLAMLGLALANVLVYYFVAVHQRRFVLGLLVGGVAFAVLLSRLHANLGQFTRSVTVSIDLMALVLLAMYLAGHPLLARVRGRAASQ